MPLHWVLPHYVRHLPLAIGLLSENIQEHAFVRRARRHKKSEVQLRFTSKKTLRLQPFHTPSTTQSYRFSVHRSTAPPFAALSLAPAHTMSIETPASAFHP